MSAILLTEPFLLVLKATVLLAGGGLLAVAARGAPAAVRHLVWAGTLVALLMLLPLTYGLPRWTLPVLPAGALAAGSPAPESPFGWLDAMAPPVAPADAPVASPQPAPAPAPVAAAPDRADAATPWYASVHPLLLLWGFGTMIVLVWIAAGQVGVYRLRRGARPVRDGEWLAEAYDAAWLLDIMRPVALLRGEGTTPMTWGLLWPIVLLPAEAGEWTAERRRMVLLHELAHVRRRDCFTQLIAHLACALFWFHPLVWYAARQLRVERERACDDLVVRTGASAADYAEHLLQVARTLRVPRATGTAIAMARPSQLEGRLLAVLDPGRRREAPSATLRFAAALGIVLLAIPIAVLQPGVAAAANGEALALADLEHDGAVPVAEAAAPRPEPFAAAAKWAGQDLQWQGTVRRGGTLAVHNWNGPIRATGGGARAGVAGQRSETRREQREVRLEAVEHSGGVTVCVLPEGAQCTADGIRDDERRRTGHGVRHVNLTVQVPEGVNLRAHSMNGGLRIENVGGDVHAVTMNGEVSASASGVVHATTMNGALTVAMGRTDWRGELELTTMNGRIRVTLPADASTDVSAHTMSGGIWSDFPLNISSRTNMPRASGTIGGGGRSLKLTTMNGGIEIARVGGALPGATRTRDAAPPRPANPPRAARDRGRDGWDGFASSMEEFGESMAGMGESIAEAVTQAVSSAFAGGESTRRRDSPETYVRRLRTDPDPEVRRIAAWGLSRSRGEGAEALAEALTSDRDAHVREMAAWSLGTLRNRGGVPALRRALAGDADAKVRCTSLWALERLGDDAVAPALPAATADRDQRVRHRAAWMIGDRRIRDGFDALTRALRDDDAEVRQAAAWSLGRLADPRAVPHLERALDDRNTEVRRAALWAAARIDDPAADPLVEKASRDRSGEIRRLALGVMGGEPWPWPWPWPMPMPRPFP